MTAEVEAILAAIEDSERAWPFNAHLIEDRQVDEAVRTALDGRLTAREEYELSDVRVQPQVVPAKTELCAQPLLDTLLRSEPYKIQSPCDRCHQRVHPVARLWVPAGASIVELACCAVCRSELDEQYAPVWR
jgi:hypothetical protein